MVKLIFKFSGDSKKQEELIDYVVKKYNGKFMRCYPSTDSSFIEDIFSSIPYLGNLIISKYNTVVIETPCKVKIICSECGFPKHKKDMIKRSKYSDIPVCRCCEFRSERWAYKDKKKDFENKLMVWLKLKKAINSKKDNEIYKRKP